MYDYQKSLKSDVSDELINTYLLRPIAGRLVKALYDTPITPNQLTIASTVAGLVAAAFYLEATAVSIAMAGLFVTIKDILDSADGQLARAKNHSTRIGRFLDSIGDFIVNVAVFASIGWILFTSTGEVTILVMAFFGLLGITLRVSYHVFYHTSFLHMAEKYEINRLTEEITAHDLQESAPTLRLQRIFGLMYGWQDRLMLRIDRWCRQGREDGTFLKKWYSDLTGVRISGFLGFGTELFLLTVCSVVNELELYLVLNILLMNTILLTSILYRRVVLLQKLEN
jgi:phosphatidylglycerophosphate synthase